MLKQEIVIVGEPDIYAQGLKSLVENNLSININIQPIKNLYQVISQNNTIVFIDLSKLDKTNFSIFQRKHQNQTILVNWSDEPNWDSINYCLNSKTPYFCTKNTSPQELTNLFQSIIFQEAYLGKSELATKIIQKINLRLLNSPKINLSHRDIEIIKSYEQWRNIKKVSQSLQLSYGYLRNKFQELRVNFNVEDNKDLIERAYQLDLI